MISKIKNVVLLKPSQISRAQKSLRQELWLPISRKDAFSAGVKLGILDGAAWGHRVHGKLVQRAAYQSLHKVVHPRQACVTFGVWLGLLVGLFSGAKQFFTYTLQRNPRKIVEALARTPEKDHGNLMARLERWSGSFHCSIKWRPIYFLLRHPTCTHPMRSVNFYKYLAQQTDVRQNNLIRNFEELVPAFETGQLADFFGCEKDKFVDGGHEHCSVSQPHLLEHLCHNNSTSHGHLIGRLAQTACRYNPFAAADALTRTLSGSSLIFHPLICAAMINGFDEIKQRNTDHHRLLISHGTDGQQDKLAAVAAMKEKLESLQIVVPQKLQQVLLKTSDLDSIHRSLSALIHFAEGAYRDIGGPEKDPRYGIFLSSMQSYSKEQATLSAAIGAATLDSLIVVTRMFEIEPSRALYIDDLGHAHSVMTTGAWSWNVICSAAWGAERDLKKKNDKSF